jgi:hypothetical protein
MRNCLAVFLGFLMSVAAYAESPTVQTLELGLFGGEPAFDYIGADLLLPRGRQVIRNYSGLN